MYKVEVFMAEIRNKPEKSFIPRELIVHYLDQSIDFTKKIVHPKVKSNDNFNDPTQVLIFDTKVRKMKELITYNFEAFR